jgi:hypothetical protein
LLEAIRALLAITRTNRNRGVIALPAGLAAVVAIVGAGCSDPKPPTPSRTGLSMTATAYADEYAAGEPIRLGVSITNQGSRACQLIAIPDGTLTVVSMTRDGVAVTPAVTSSEYINGFSDFLRKGFRELPPGQSITLSATSWQAGAAGGVQALDTSQMDTSDEAARIFWPVDAPGRYVLGIRYSLPPVDGAPAGLCEVPDAPAQLEFTVRAAP